LARPIPDSRCESFFIAAPDGLKLHLRAYGRRLAPRLAGLPVMCLAGLSRTLQDFDALARALAGDAAAPRLVLALDYRGRGLSDYDRTEGGDSQPAPVTFQAAQDHKIGHA
jgi:pimeloyl-ACP methyl ester carboxylesterase